MNRSECCCGGRCSLQLAVLLLAASIIWGAGEGKAAAQERPAAPADGKAAADAATEGETKSPEERAKEHFAQGNSLFFASKYPEAGLEYRKTLELMPNLANPHKNLARCYLAMKQENMYPDAAFHLLRYRQLKPQDDDVKVLADLRDVITVLGLPGAPGKELEEVSRLLEEQGTAAAEEEKWAVSVLRFEQLRDLHPGRTELLKLLAESYLGALRCTDAQRTYQAYLLVHPEEQDGLELDAIYAECTDEARSRGIEGGPPGKLVVIANVTGAVVLIDGKRVGNTPLDGPLRLAGGDHHLALFKEGYETLSQKVTVKPGATEQVKLQMAVFDMGGGSSAAATGAAGQMVTAPTGPGRGQGGALALQSQVGLIAGLGGDAGSAVGPSVTIAAGYELTGSITAFAEGGFHTYSRELSQSPPFREGKLASTVISGLVGAEYRQPLGAALSAVGGLGVGLARAGSTLSGDAGDDAELASSVVCLRAHLGAELGLGPGNLAATVSYLAHPLHTISISYLDERLLDDVVFGGLGFGLGYRYAF